MIAGWGKGGVILLKLPDSFGSVFKMVVWSSLCNSKLAELCSSSSSGSGELGVGSGRVLNTSVPVIGDLKSGDA